MASEALSIRVYLLWRNRMSNMFWKIKLSSYEIWGGFITAPLLSYVYTKGGHWLMMWTKGSTLWKLHFFKGYADRKSPKRHSCLWHICTVLFRFTFLPHVFKVFNVTLLNILSSACRECNVSKPKNVLYFDIAALFTHIKCLPLYVFPRV